MALLSTERLSKSFGGIRALSQASVSAQEGAITGLIGPNGAGKTTLFNTVSGFTPANSGKVLFNGQEITRLKPWQIVRRGLSRTFQTPSGFASMNVWENLMAAGAGGQVESPLGALRGGTATRQEQRRISNQVANLLGELDLSGVLDRPLAELSVADMRFVEIARQLMSAPKMLMLDEPAAGFGPDKIDQLDRLVRRLKDAGTTVLIIEHNLSFVLKLADYVFVLANGAVISEGPPEQVSKDEAVIRNYIGAGHGAA